VKHQVDFYYDIGSPYSYLAATQIEAITAEHGAVLVWKPMLLGGLYKTIGNRSPIELEPRFQYMRTDLQRWAHYYGVPFQYPTAFKPHTLLAMRTLAGLAGPKVPGGSHLLFHACWVEGRDISQAEVLADILGSDAVAQATAPATKATLRAVTDEAAARGAFGAPSFFLGDDLYFGNDRLPFLEQALRSH
jgi:2-hydroxychromene-2-carboxylate isomerase